MGRLEALKPLGLLVLRLAIGAIMIAHGYPKLFTQAERNVGFFAQIGFPAWMAYLAGVVEFFGGILLIGGFLTRVVGLVIAVEMAVAIFKVHWPNGLTGQGGYEYPLIVGCAALALATVGAGVISLDRLIFGKNA
jgi:putative oxidoreductase